MADEAATPAKKPGKTPQEIKQLGTFLSKFVPGVALVGKDGKPSKLALEAKEKHGQKLPKTAEDAAALAEKGKQQLAKYEQLKEKAAKAKEKAAAAKLKEKEKAAKEKEKAKAAKAKEKAAAKK